MDRHCAKLVFRALLIAAAMVRSRDAHAQIAVSANDGKVTLIDGVNSPRTDPQPDTVTLLDISAKPPRVLGEVRAPTSVVGPTHSVAITPDKSLALVTASTRIDPANPRATIPDNRVTVIDLKARPPVAIKTLEAGQGASGVAINRNGTLALVANRNEGTVSIFSISGQAVVPAGKVDFGARDSQPSQVLFAADGRTAFVSRSAATDNRVSILTVDGTRVEYAKRDIFTGLQPYGMDITPSGDLAVVANIGTGATGGSDTVTLVDLKANPPRSIDQLAVGPIPEGISISPNGRYVAVTVMNGTNTSPTSPFFHDFGLLKILEIRGRKLELVAESRIGRWCQGTGWAPGNNAVLAQCMVERAIQILSFDGKALKPAGEIKINGGPGGLRTAY
ncbi:MAG TPA: YncE family protein [Terriglobia bacterium]|nr:YncE family protein [Terriglobia bacterium]